MLNNIKKPGGDNFSHISISRVTLVQSGKNEIFLSFFIGERIIYIVLAIKILDLIRNGADFMYVTPEAEMNVIKINKRIESSDVHIDGLDKFIGKDAEIIVLIENEQESSWPDNFFDETYGFMNEEKLTRTPQGIIPERDIIK